MTLRVCTPWTALPSDLVSNTQTHRSNIQQIYFYKIIFLKVLMKTRDQFCEKGVLNYKYCIILQDQMPSFSTILQIGCYNLKL